MCEYTYVHIRRHACTTIHVIVLRIYIHSNDGTYVAVHYTMHMLHTKCTAAYVCAILPPHVDPQPAEGSQSTRGREQQDFEGTGGSAAGKYCVGVELHGCMVLSESALYPGLVSLQREQAALRAIEEQHEREEKRREQEATKVALDRSLKLKLRRKVSGCGAKDHCLLCIEHPGTCT